MPCLGRCRRARPARNSCNNKPVQRQCSRQLCPWRLDPSEDHGRCTSTTSVSRASADGPNKKPTRPVDQGLDNGGCEDNWKPFNCIVGPVRTYDRASSSTLRDDSECLSPRAINSTLNRRASRRRRDGRGCPRSRHPARPYRGRQGPAAGLGRPPFRQRFERGRRHRFMGPEEVAWSRVRNRSFPAPRPSASPLEGPAVESRPSVVGQLH